MGAITTIAGLQNFTNLTRLDLDQSSHGVETIDVSGLTNLTYLDVSDMEIPDTNIHSLKYVNVSGCTSLERLYIDDSDFSEGFPDLSGLNSLIWVDADQCDITGSIDLSNLPSLKGFDFGGNTELTEVIISSSQPLGDDWDVNASNCALTQTAIDNILIALSENEISNGFVNLEGDNSSWPSSSGLAAIDILEGRGWSCTVNPTPPGRVGIAASSDFDIVGNFTIEMFVNFSNTDGNPRPYSFGVYPAANAISFEAGTAYFWGNNGILLSGSFNPTLGQWYHICVQRSGSELKMFVDGTSIASTTNSDNIPSQSLPLTIGYGNEPNSGFNGLMSNFRWSAGARYSNTSFAKPTASLQNEPGITKLLIFQGNNLAAQLVDNSGNNHNATNSGAIFSTNDPFDSAAGSLQMGNV